MGSQPANHWSIACHPYTTGRTRNYDNVGSSRQAASGLAAAPRAGLQYFAQALAIERFDEKSVEASSERGLAVLDLDVGGEGEHPGGLVGGLRFDSPDAARGLKAIHSRHLHIHQHEIVGAAGSARRQP